MAVGRCSFDTGGPVRWKLKQRESRNSREGKTGPWEFSFILSLLVRFSHQHLLSTIFVDASSLNRRSWVFFSWWTVDSPSFELWKMKQGSPPKLFEGRFINPMQPSHASLEPIVPIYYMWSCCLVVFHCYSDFYCKPYYEILSVIQSRCVSWVGFGAMTMLPVHLYW